MNIHDLWHSFYGERFPIAYLLRPQIPDLWFRIHSLPESKRYAENEDETQEILRRHNTVAEKVLGISEQCMWFVPNYAFQKYSSTFAEFSGNVFCKYEDQDTKITLLAAQTVWRPHQFDAALRLVADDVVRYVSWMNIESGEIFAPYDGGADLFLNSTERRDEVRDLYSDWLSPFPGGT